ncbi:nucleoside hydrolase [Chroococcidiopsis sp. CCMEE 29]|uniref:nucleoside hydrolase n=1 Tax=Chroococcidiopsis sp. CCMEE 29 TaxID=155894 RepID=UPI00202272F4|nr:nucleoside hydrolase [Chroococcidiopsis sp. CCMEE 29]
MKIHLDTDFGSDIDDICALAMLLRWSSDAHLTGVTTVAEINGRRAGQVKHVLELEGRNDIPVAAGADISQGFYPYELGLPPEERYWARTVAPLPKVAGEAVELLKQSVEQDATVIGIGPFTNLYLLESQYPGILLNTRLFLMGGYVYPPREGFPQWGNDDDFNVQVDARSALCIIENSDPTFVPLSVTVETALRRKHLEVLRGGGALGQLLARQAEAFAEDEQIGEKFGKTCNKLPRDIINFQHDPLTCAIALGWHEGVETSHAPLKTELRDGVLHWRIDPDGKPTRVVTKIDGDRFSQFWVDTVAGVAYT